MTTVFWTGHLSPSMRLLANTNSTLWWMLGRHRQMQTTKSRIRDGYDAKFSDHVKSYDRLASDIHAKIVNEQLSGIDLAGMSVLDVGAGTGTAGFACLDRGAGSVVCADFSSRMLQEAEGKAEALGYGSEHISFQQADAEEMPFASESFDVVTSSLLLGLVPNQQKAIGEMARVVRLGGVVVVAAHGPEYFWEAADATFRSVNKRYVLGYRFEFWPRTEEAWAESFRRAGLTVESSRRVMWKNRFEGGGEVFDFFATVSSSWWMERFPVDRRTAEAERGRRYFEKKGLKELTDDVVFIVARRSAEVETHVASPGPRMND